MAKHAFKVGDWFRREGNPPTNWQLSRLVSYPNVPDHVSLLRNGDESDSITISVAVLQEKKLFKRIAEQE